MLSTGLRQPKFGQGIYGPRLGDRGQQGHQQPKDGFPTHEIIDGWGNHNVFRYKVFGNGVPGLGINLAPMATRHDLCHQIEWRADVHGPHP